MGWDDSQVGRFKMGMYVMELHCVCVCLTINKIGSEMMSKINYSFNKRRKRRYRCEKIDNQFRLEQINCYFLFIYILSKTINKYYFLYDNFSFFN